MSVRCGAWIDDILTRIHHASHQDGIRFDMSARSSEKVACQPESSLNRVSRIRRCHEPRSELKDGGPCGKNFCINTSRARPRTETRVDFGMNRAHNMTNMLFTPVLKMMLSSSSQLYNQD